MTSAVLLESSLAGLPVTRGKVRDMYDLGDRMLMVSTDRISAFDWVLPTGIPDKGCVLTQLSAFWFGCLQQPHHLITTNLSEMPLPDHANHELLQGRTMLVRKTRVVPVESVVRGYLAGSGWKEYQRSGTVCGVALRSGLTEASRLDEPIFTPATKAESGHDENITFQQMANLVGVELAHEIQQRSLEIYRKGAALSAQRGIILADTKFEWGWDGDRLILIDEVMTPDSSRFWPRDEYQPGQSQLSFDKQFVRDWLESTQWDKNSPPPNLPSEVVIKTRAKYVEAFERITGNAFG